MFLEDFFFYEGMDEKGFIVIIFVSYIVCF